MYYIIHDCILTEWYAKELLCSLSVCMCVCVECVNSLHPFASVYRSHVYVSEAELLVKTKFIIAMIVLFLKYKYIT